MKKSAIIAWAILCALPLLFSFKNNPIPPKKEKGYVVKVKPLENKRAFKLRLFNLQKQPTRIILKDAKDRVLLSEKILDHNGYRKLFNLQNLNNGKYTLMVLHPVESKSAELKIKGRAVNIHWD